MARAIRETSGADESPELTIVETTDLDLTGHSELVTDHGRTIISNDVVAKIAGVTVRRTQGVHALVPYGSGQKVSAFARRITGAVMRDLGVQVEVGKIQAAVDVRIITTYGHSIVEVASQIRNEVRRNVEHMTGLEVVEVNIEVVDLYFAEHHHDSFGRAASRVQ